MSKFVDLSKYSPAYFTWIANKLSGGASSQYLRLFNVGIETWRCLVLLAIDSPISAQYVCKIIGMDKASVSRCFQRMQAQGFIKISEDPTDKRSKLAALTAKGRRVHDQILDLALERERAFVSVLTAAEQATLMRLLKKLHENLPQVEQVSEQYITQRWGEESKS